MSVLRAVNRSSSRRHSLDWHLDNEGMTDEQEDFCEPASYQREGIHGLLRISRLQEQSSVSR
ncbi:hypothetical protein MPL1032_190285 [Mesorhizobium plurifarium]|uniref:Uncharacterized protein n=1 Tax=Mesorhizobium plurifarium TaxID=69974 RepID=A0A0K2VVB7_MESPL|nr:hypothetical protein MPL1032_190285 [Mesorhizobium plurifarium]